MYTNTAALRSTARFELDYFSQNAVAVPTADEGVSGVNNIYSFKGKSCVSAKLR